MLNGANVLVTGGAGFIGSNLIQRLLDVGAHVTATEHDKKPQFDPRAKYYWADLTLQEDCQGVVEGMDYVFHCAAVTSGAAVIEKSPLTHFTPNVLMNVSMLDAAHKAGVKKFAFISSQVVYPPFGFPVKEDEVTNQFHPKYEVSGWMKRFSEIACQFHADQMDVCVVRPGNIYGEYDNFDPETSHVIPALIRKVVERQNPIEVWGDGKDVRDFIYIQDFIDGLILAMEKTQGFDIINIASGESFTIKYIIETLCWITDTPISHLMFDWSKPRTIPIREMDISKAKRLGFEPKVSLEEGLQRTMDWYHDHQQNTI